MLLLLDNYDSFTWNLYHYFEQLAGETIVVKRNDEIATEEAGAFNGIIFSPGPGLPREAGNMMDIIERHSATIPMLGICLGHQALAESYGAELYNLDQVLHGTARTTYIKDPRDLLFSGMPPSFSTGHYHSWMVSSRNFPDQLKITATSDHGEIMAISHVEYPFSGVQFHPESILTSSGLKIISNWLQHYRLS